MYVYHIRIKSSQKFWVVYVRYRFIPEQCALFIILVGLTMTSFSDNDKMLIFHRCISGLMTNLIKKSWTVSKHSPFI